MSDLKFRLCSWLCLVLVFRGVRVWGLGFKILVWDFRASIRFLGFGLGFGFRN